MKFYQEENLKIMEQKKNLEEKQNYNKFASNSYKSQIQSKENEINILKDEMKNFEIFKNEKPKLEKRVMDLQKQLSVLKEDNERKTQRIKDLDKIVFNNKVSFEQEMDNLTSMMNKKLKVLEHENSNLRKSEANKDKLGIKSSAFLTETKLEKKETTESIEEVRGKIKNLEGKICLF
jgi:DNA repair exonuclease SbcCD ATPase subunit